MPKTRRGDTVWRNILFAGIAIPERARYHLALRTRG